MKAQQFSSYRNQWRIFKQFNQLQELLLEKICIFKPKLVTSKCPSALDGPNLLRCNLKWSKRVPAGPDAAILRHLSNFQRPLGTFLLEVINSWVLFVDNWALFHSNHPVTLNTTQIFFFFQWVAVQLDLFLPTDCPGTPPSRFSSSKPEAPHHS